MESLTIAVATDDGENLIDRHFGDARYYYIYKLSPRDVTFLTKIENTTEEERMHADPVKARGVTAVLKDKNVHVAVAKVFGPNIKRIKKKFVCVLAGTGTVEEKLEVLKDRVSELLTEWKTGEERKIIKL